jgi:predicted transcriptional regulator
MYELPQWLVIVVGSVVPMVAFAGFWMQLSARLTKAETLADKATESAREAQEKLTLLSNTISEYKEQVAKEYIHRAIMKDVEDRLTAAIDRLGDRLDRMFERSGK